MNYLLFLLVILLSCSENNKNFTNLNKTLIDSQKIDNNISKNNSKLTRDTHRIDYVTFFDRVNEGKIFKSESKEGLNLLKKLEKENFSTVKGIGLSASNNSKSSDTLIQFAVSDLGKEFIFGGVVIDVSDSKNYQLGQFLGANTSVFHGILNLIKLENTEKYFAALDVCFVDCEKPNAKTEAIISIPLVGVSSGNNFLTLDLGALKDDLNYVELLDPTGAETGLVTRKNNLSVETADDENIIFDVTSSMNIVNEIGATDSKIVDIKNRWFLKKYSSNNKFKARSVNKNLGYLWNFEGQEEYIQRFATPIESGKKVHYFVKNFPKFYYKSVEKSFSDWNKLFSKIIGEDLFTFEFLDMNNPMFEKVRAGDIRYNVIVYNDKNALPYVGNGPAILDQKNGEVLAGRIYINGSDFPNPKFVNIENIVRKSYQSNVKDNFWNRFDQLKDDIFDDNKFNILKNKFKLNLLGFGYTDYYHRKNNKVNKVSNKSLTGYTLEADLSSVLSHEIGHNIGLTHNFMGSLKGEAHDKAVFQRNDIVPGEVIVTSSIMEYLEPSFSYLMELGEYDTQAIQYGYMGIKPILEIPFCNEFTNNIKLAGKSGAECDSTDVGNDPFSYFTDAVDTLVDIYVGTNTNSLSNVSDALIFRYMQGPINSIIGYIRDVDNGVTGWHNFYGKLSRPQKDLVSTEYYLYNTLHSSFCDQEKYQKAINNKTLESQKNLAKERIRTLREDIYIDVLTRNLNFPKDLQECSFEEDLDSLLVVN